MTDFALYATYATRLCHFSEVARVGSGVEMIGIIQFMVGQNTKAVSLGCFKFSAVITIRFCNAFLLAAHPKVLKPARPTTPTGVAKGMYVIMSFVEPVLKSNTELKSAVGALDEVWLRYLE